jgi:hypothetical protein
MTKALSTFGKAAATSVDMMILTGLHSSSWESQTQTMVIDVPQIWEFNNPPQCFADSAKQVP